MNVFYDLQEKTRKMDESHSSGTRSAKTSESKMKRDEELSYDEKEEKERKNERKSCALLAIGVIGTLILLYIFIRLYIAIGNNIFNSSIFEVIAIVGFIGVVLYILSIIGSLICHSFADAKSTGGKSILVLAVFIMVTAIVFTLMNRCS